MWDAGSSKKLLIHQESMSALLDQPPAALKTAPNYGHHKLTTMILLNLTPERDCTSHMFAIVTTVMAADAVLGIMLTLFSGLCLSCYFLLLPAPARAGPCIHLCLSSEQLCTLLAACTDNSSPSVNCSVQVWTVTPGCLHMLVDDLNATCSGWSLLGYTCVILKSVLLMCTWQILSVYGPVQFKILSLESSGTCACCYAD